MPSPQSEDLKLPEPIGLFEAIDSQRTLRYIKPDPGPAGIPETHPRGRRPRRRAEATPNPGSSWLYKTPA